MATSIEAKIVNGLLGWWQGVTLPAGAEVAYPNIAFSPSGAPYVRLSIQKNTPTTRHIGGGKEPERMGLFMAVVCWPVGKGIIAPSELAGAIRNRFAFNTKIVHDGIVIRIVEEPRVAGDIQGPVYSETPVIVPWHVYP